MARNVCDSEWRKACDIIVAVIECVGRTAPTLDDTLDELYEIEQAKFALLVATFARLLEECLAPEEMKQLRRNRRGVAVASATDKPKS